MRITNQMISNNSLRNMQKTMANVDNRTTQMETGKKITKASEDPVVAVRALKLRTMVTQLEQYKDKNIGDAESWLKITTTSLDNITSRLEDIQSYCTQGSTDSFKTSDRSAIIDVLKEMQDMINSEGNSTYAGRYIFSGYKTDRSLAFNETEDIKKYSYKITQHLNADDLDMKTVVLNGVNNEDVDGILAGTSTYVKPDKEQVYRLNLAYEGISSKDSQGNAALSLKALDANGNTIDLSGFTQTVKTTADADTYYQVGPDEINIIEETGEIIFGENVYNTLKQADDIVVDYAKNKFEAGDLRPEHYFDCEDLTNGQVYTLGDNQDIEYTINFSQTLKVNTRATDVLSYNIGRDLDDLMSSLTNVADIEAKITKLTNMKNSELYAGQKDQIESMIEASNKELDYAKSYMEDLFAKGITQMKGYQSTLNSEISDVGSREVRLTLAESRLTQQQTTFKDLKSKNEDVELEDITVEFASAETVYDAAIATAAKTVRQSLLDYI